MRGWRSREGWRSKVGINSCHKICLAQLIREDVGGCMSKKRWVAHEYVGWNHQADIMNSQKYHVFFLLIVGEESHKLSSLFGDFFLKEDECVGRKWAIVFISDLAMSTRAPHFPLPTFHPLLQIIAAVLSVNYHPLKSPVKGNALPTDIIVWIQFLMWEQIKGELFRKPGFVQEVREREKMKMFHFQEKWIRNHYW